MKIELKLNSHYHMTATKEADREPEAIPSLFTAIRVSFTVYGDIPADRVERAVKLSMDKCCSVAKILEKTAPITYDYKVEA